MKKLFGNLFCGTTVDVFLKSYWENRELFTQDAIIPAEFFSIREFENIINVHSRYLGNSIIRLIKEGKVIPENLYTNLFNERRVGQVRGLDLKVFQKYCDNGCTVAFTGLNNFSQTLHQYCDQLSEELSEPVQVNGYLSQKGVQGFDAHYDHHEIFIIQIDGEKEWTVYGKPEMFPLATETHYYQGKPDLGRKRTFVLKPGDTLYLPRGLWHMAKATKRSSLHLTLNIKCSLVVDFIQWVIGELAKQKADYRKNLSSFVKERNKLFELAKDIRSFSADTKKLISAYYQEKKSINNILLPFKN